MSEQIERMVNRFLSWKLPEDFAPDAGVSFTPSPSGWPVGTNLLTAAQALAMIEHIMVDDGYEKFRRDHDAAVLYERACYHLMQLMVSYERRVRSDCTPEQIEKRPWQSLEYLAAADFLRRTWNDAPITRAFVGYAWLIETNDRIGPTRYLHASGDWCDNPCHAMRFVSEQAARDSDVWRELQYPGNMRIAEHEFTA